MDYIDQAEALITRNRALIAEAAMVRIDVQRRLLQVRAARNSLRHQMVDIQRLKKRAREAASDAAERVVRSRGLRAGSSAWGGNQDGD